MRILLSGGSGLIGSALRTSAESQGHEVGMLLRRDPSGPRQWRWHPNAHQVPAEAIEWADAVVNLSGAPIGRFPWTAGYRRELLESRLTATTTLATAISGAAEPPSVLVSGSAVGYYGNRPSELLNESSDPGRGFLAGLCERWEAAAVGANTRVVTIRTGLVLANGGALAPLMLATGMGAAARVGPGTQIWPWIALADEVGAILHLLTAPVTGPVNLVAPQRNTSEDVTRTLAEVMHRPHVFALPSPLLRLPLGAAADEMLLLTQAIEPAALVESGYEFTQPDLRGAIERAVRR